MSRPETVRVRPQADSYRLVGAGRQKCKEANQFLRSLQIRGLSPHTVRAYAFDIAVLYRWLGTRKMGLAQLQAADLLQFVAAQQKACAAPATINRRLSTCQLLYKFCTGKSLPHGRGGWSPARYYRGRGKDRYLGLHQLKPPARLKLRVRMPRKVIEPLKADMVIAFVATLRRYRDLAIVYLMLLCGLRTCEALGLQLDDLSLDEQRIRVRGKGDKQRWVPLPALLVQVVGDYLRLERPARCHGRQLLVVLQGRRRGYPMSAEGMRSLFRYRRRRAAISMANAHRFRHTFGADMARAGVPLAILQKLMGHDNALMTLQYINLSMSDVADAYRQAMKQIDKRYHNS